MSKKRKNRLENFITGKSDVIKFKPIEDNSGRYIPYCNFRFHKGIVNNYELCEERNCRSYHKLYINL